MSSLVLYCPNYTELSMVISVTRFLLRRMGLQSVEPLCLNRPNGLKPYLEQNNGLDCLVCDVTAERILPILEHLRRLNPEMRLVLVADDTVPPVRYIRPSILPTALLWRPVNREEARQVLGEVYAALTVRPEQEEQEQCFAVEMRGGRRFFSYGDILFFESRDKRIYLHSQREEIPFFDTLEGLSERLPDCFIRVHKSFIVNRTRIGEIQFGQSYLVLEGGMTIPVSRTYKARLKAVFS